MIKICGTTSISDAQLAARAGADCIGIVVNHPASPRHVSLETARAIAASVAIGVVAVSVNQSLDSLLEIAEILKPHALQLHGDESSALVRELVINAPNVEIWKAIAGDEATLRGAAKLYTDAGAQALLVDARAHTATGIIYGGTGQSADWDAARALSDDGFRVILAGGLTPQNVADALQIARPWGADVVSGVEARKGVKDAEKLRAFVANARARP